MGRWKARQENHRARLEAGRTRPNSNWTKQNGKQIGTLGYNLHPLCTPPSKQLFRTKWTWISNKGGCAPSRKQKNKIKLSLTQMNRMTTIQKATVATQPQRFPHEGDDGHPWRRCWSPNRNASLSLPLHEFVAPSHEGDNGHPPMTSWFLTLKRNQHTGNNNFFEDPQAHFGEQLKQVLKIKTCFLLIRK